MRGKLTFLAILITVSTTGCRGFDMPRCLRGSPKPDRPELSIEEQQRNGRGRYGIIEDDFRTGPKGFVDRPTPTGR